MRPSRVQVRCFPADDRDFAAVATELVATAWGRISETERLIDATRLRLRRRYPNADIRPQSPLGGLALDTQVVYVYRDGTAA